MNMQEIFDAAGAARRTQVMKKSPQLTLGQLIEILERINTGHNKNSLVYLDFMDFRPAALESWRGSYRELAITYDKSGTPLKLSEFVTMLNGALGKMYQGYKGGDFKMDEDTPVWVDNYGESHNTGVIGVVETDDRIIIETAYCQF